MPFILKIEDYSSALFQPAWKKLYHTVVSKLINYLYISKDTLTCNCNNYHYWKIIKMLFSFCRVWVKASVWYIYVSRFAFVCPKYTFCTSEQYLRKSYSRVSSSLALRADTPCWNDSPLGSYFSHLKQSMIKIYNSQHYYFYSNCLVIHTSHKPMKGRWCKGWSRVRSCWDADSLL